MSADTSVPFIPFITLANIAAIAVVIETLGVGITVVLYIAAFNLTAVSITWKYVYDKKTPKA